MASLTRHVLKSNMPNVCYSNGHLKQTYSDRTVRETQHYGRIS